MLRDLCSGLSSSHVHVQDFDLELSQIKHFPGKNIKMKKYSHDQVSRKYFNYSPSNYVCA